MLVLHQLHLEQYSTLVPLSQSDLGALLKDLAHVERLLKDVDLLSGLARLLPKGACTGRASASTANTTGPLNATTTTTWGANTTDIPAEEGPEGVEAGGGGGGGKATEEVENPHSQFSAFVQLWAGLQPILCGHNRWVKPAGATEQQKRRQTAAWFTREQMRVFTAFSLDFSHCDHDKRTIYHLH